MDIRPQLQILRANWYLPVVIALAGAAAGFGASKASTKQYMSTAQVFVSVNSSAVSQSTSVYAGSQFAMAQIMSYIRLARSSKVLAPAAKDIGRRIPKGAITATNPSSTVMINVSATGPDPALTALQANAVARRLADFIPKVETKLADGTSAVKATLIEPAGIPKSAISPKTRNNTMLGGLIGLILGVGLAFLRVALNSKVSSAADLAKLSDAPLLATVHFDASSERSPLLVGQHGGRRSEDFRTLRTNLEFLDVDDPPRAIVVLSCMPGDGKSVTAANLAIMLSVAGKSVCLIEADLRKPRLGHYLGVEDAVGLTGVLSGKVELETALVEWNRGLVTFLPAGELPPNPSELLGSSQMQSLVGDLRDRFDYVIVDSAPLIPVTDGSILSRICDGALLVVRHGKTKRPEIESAVASVSSAGGRVLGTVYNCAPLKRSARAGYGYIDSEAAAVDPPAGDAAVRSASSSAT